jgi:hypothetical protein
MWGICSACLATATLQHIIGPGVPRDRPIMGRVGHGVRAGKGVCVLHAWCKSVGHWVLDC